MTSGGPRQMIGADFSHPLGDPDMNDNLMKLAMTAGALFAAYKFGSPEVRAAALGVVGFIALNQIPVLRDGAQVRLVA